MSQTALQTYEIETPAPAPAVTPMAMIDRALALNAAPETLERLLALQERWEATQARKAFDAAMADAKGEIGPIAKNRAVDFTSAKGRTNYRHEDLAEIARTVDPVLRRHGLSYRFRTTSAVGEPVSVTCIVSHRLGHSEENTLLAGRDESGNKNSIQAVGSTITYLSRYALKAALGLAADDDDDGRAAGGGNTISNEQCGKLLSLAEEVGADIPKFCEYLRIGAIPDLPSKDFQRAMDALEKKRRAA